MGIAGGNLSQRPQASKPDNVRRIEFSSDIVSDPDKLSVALSQFSSSISQLLGTLGSNPFTRGVVLKEVRLNGTIGQIDTIAGADVTMWHAKDALLAQPGDILVVATSDGITRGAQRAGSVTVATSISTGIIRATGNWAAGIAAVAVGDYVFRSGEFSSNQTIKHGLPAAPRWAIVLGVVGSKIGSPAPTISILSSDNTSITIVSSRAAIADILLLS